MVSEKQRPPGVRRLLAVGSGKGGVGKTTIAVNLAFALRRLGLSIGLFDADVYGPNVQILFGEIGHPRRAPLRGSTVQGDALRMIPLGRKDTEPYIPPVRKFGIEVLSLGFWFDGSEAVDDAGPTIGQMVRQTILDTRWSQLDVLIVDLPPGTGEPQHTLLATVSVDAAVLVSTGHALSEADVRRAERHFEEHGVALAGYVTNMTHAVCPECGSRIQLFESSGREMSGIPRLGDVPMSPALGRPLDHRHPLTDVDPSGLVADALLDLGRAVRSALFDE